MQIPLSQIINQNFRDTIEHLYSLKLPFKVSYQLSDTIDTVVEHQKKFQEVLAKHQKDIAIKDENGEPVMDENNNMKLDPTKIMDAEKELNEFLDNTMVDIEPIEAKILEDKEFTPAQVKALKPILKMD